MIEDLLKDAGTRMDKAIEVLRREFAGLRAGRATPALLDRVRVDYYGVPTPVTQLATVLVPEPRLLVIQPWDKTIVGAVEKAILKSDLGITPINDGQAIRLTIPRLTSERRQELIKLVRKLAEEARVSARNVRREVNDDLRSLEKDSDITEDQYYRALEKAQKITDASVEQIDDLLEQKEKELSEV
ncbi:MAG: ribosome recycling factor [Bacillota bacterium]|nr:ribosome recycling factor [Bacillota bacterium]